MDLKEAFSRTRSLPGKLHSRSVALKGGLWQGQIFEGGFGDLLLFGRALLDFAVALKEAFSRPGLPGPSFHCKSFFFFAFEEGLYHGTTP